MYDSYRSFKNQQKIDKCCKRKRTLKDHKTGEEFMMPCRSAHCGCEVCRAEYSRIKANNLHYSLDRLPSHFYLVLKFLEKKGLPYEFFKGFWQQLNEKLHDQRKKWVKENSDKYLWLLYSVHFEINGTDIQWFVRTNAFQWAEELHEYIRPLMVECAPCEDIDLYCEETYDDYSCSKYAVGDVRGREHCIRPPKDWRRKRLVGGNNNFWVANQKTIEKEWKKQLFPEQVVEKASEN